MDHRQLPRILSFPRHTLHILWTHPSLIQDRWRKRFPLRHTYACHRCMHLSCGTSNQPPLKTDLPCRFKKNLLKVAVVLSASVILLSLPSSDAFSRTTGMVAILFAVFSMEATVVAIFRHKADLERPISHIVGIEGMMANTVRDVVIHRVIQFALSISFFFDNII